MPAPAAPWNPRERNAKEVVMIATLVAGIISLIAFVAIAAAKPGKSIFDQGH